jgi:SAM-dependent methyltransferase
MGKVSQMHECRICKTIQFQSPPSGFTAGFSTGYSLKRCNKCAFISVDPVPTPEILKQYYNRDYWQLRQNKTAEMLHFQYKLQMLGIIRNIKKMVPHNGKILDWGAGDGALIKLLKNAGFRCWGLDTYSTHPTDTNLMNATIEDIPLPDNFFDAITCFHVLEHILDPVMSLTKAFSLLKTDGILIVEVPNIESCGFQIFKNKWHPLDLPIHLNHFSLTTMKRLLRMAGNARIIDIDYFSHRHSPSSIVLSLFPSFSPPKVRRKNSGRYPLGRMFSYLVLRLAAYPFVLLGLLIKRGEIIRMVVRKNG